MIFPSQLGSTLLRTQKLHLPQAFRRYKSITAAIERGRQDGPDRPFRPRTQAPPANGEEGGGKTRAQLRFERFGPSSDGRVYTEKPQQEHRGERSSRGPNTDPHSISVDQDGKTRSSGGDRNFKPRGSGGDRDFKPRSSRFGRVGPPGDAPSRFTEAREEMPSRDLDAFSGRREDPFDRTGNKSDRSSRPSYQSNDRAPRGDRYERSDRPPRREGKFDRGDRFPRREGQFDRGDRTPPREGQFDTPRQKPYNGAYKSDYQHVHFDRASTGPKMETSGPGDEEGGAERPERSQRLFNRTDATTPYASRPGRFQTDRPREFSRRPYDAPDGATGTISTQGMSERGPDSLPYSTAASEFIYGFSSVVAAMRANRRKIYTIYVHSRGASRDNLLTRIRALKLFPITREVGDEYLRAMDKASSGRPHNGVILESSPLPVPPITELKSTSIEDASFTVAVDSQTAEDALVNGKQELYSYKSAGWRHPLILYVDGVVSQALPLYGLY
jgi:21S rRNA (GM2251-2'-O)-methyltransferase